MKNDTTWLTTRDVVKTISLQPSLHILQLHRFDFTVYCLQPWRHLFMHNRALLFV